MTPVRCLLMIAIMLGTAPICQAQTGVDVKTDSLDYLRELRTQNVKRLQEIDASLSRKIEEQSAANLEQEVGSLKQAKREHMLRQEFLDRLIFQIDTKFRGGNLKSFVETALMDMAKIDLSSQAESGLWKFLKYAADAVRRLPEQRENILGFLEGYMSRSVANPIRPEDYLSARNYTNAARAEAGRPMDRADVGAVADQRLRESEAGARLNAAPAEQTTR